MSGRRRLLSVAKWVYVLLVSGFLAWAVWQTGGQLEGWKGWVLEPAAYAFVACWMLMALVLGAAWAQVLSLYLGLRLDVSEWLPIQAAAWVGRYLPGKVGLMAGKLVLLERPELEVKPLAFSVLFEQVAFVVAGVILALVLSPPVEVFQVRWLQAVDTAWGRWGMAVAVAAAFFLMIHVVASRLQVVARPGVLQGAALVSFYLFAHAVAGLGLHFILQVVLADDAPSLAYAIGVLAAANVAGIVAVFAPAGIGVRELVLVLGLSPFISIEEALAMSAVMRLLTVIADLAFSVIAGGGRLFRMVHRRG